LFATGRSPEVEDLRIKDLGLKLNDKNHIKVDKYQNTNIANIYALGDVCDQGFELTPVAIAAGRRLADRLFGGQSDAHLEYDTIPSVVFAHPEVGTIGLTEPAAREQYGSDNIKVYNASFTAIPPSFPEPVEGWTSGSPYQTGPSAVRTVTVPSGSIRRSRPSARSDQTTTPSRTPYSPPPYSFTRVRTFVGAGVSSRGSPPAKGRVHRLTRPPWSGRDSSQ
jgi:hypothetical protein